MRRLMTESGMRCDHITRPFWRRAFPRFESDRLPAFAGDGPGGFVGGPGLVSVIIIGLLLGGLLIGHEPVGGDPDRVFRPVKAELARALREGRLPFWSDRLGLGVP